MPPVQQESGLRTWQWVVTAIVIIVLIIIGIMVFRNKGSEPTTTPTDTTADTGSSTGTNSVVVSDQYPGNVAYISSVSMAKDGWVEIHKDNKGQPGAYIGSAFVKAGLSPVKVTLTEGIVDGGTYYAMLHSDDGDSKFDATKDLPIKDAAGNIVMRVFHGSSTADQNNKG